MPNVLYAFWILVGAFVAFEAYRLGLGALRHPGPGFFIFISAFLLFFIGVFDLVKGLVGKFKKGEVLGWSDIRWRKIGIVFAGLISYAYLLSHLGFLLATFLLMTLLFKFIESTKWWMTIAGSGVATLSAYVIFRILLNVPFPVGILGF